MGNNFLNSLTTKTLDQGLNVDAQSVVKKASKIFISIALLLATTPALSAIPYRSAYEAVDLINKDTKELNLSILANVQMIVDQNRINMEQFIPLSGLPQNDDGREVSLQIAKQTLHTISELHFISHSVVMRTANTVNEALTTRIETKKQVLYLTVRALETQAEIVYRGPVNASLSFDRREEEVKLELSKGVGHQTYAFTHTDNYKGVADTVGVRWNF